MDLAGRLDDSWLPSLCCIGWRRRGRGCRNITVRSGDGDGHLDELLFGEERF